MPKIYISSHDIDKAREVAAAVSAAGYPVISTWHLGDAPMKRSDDMTEAQKRDKAASNVDQIIGACNVLILVASEEKVPGGKFVEAGVALGCKRKVYVWGRRENILLHHPSVKVFDSLEELIAALPAAPSPTPQP
jgi:hypothetical protein